MMDFRLLVKLFLIGIISIFTYVLGSSFTSKNLNDMSNHMKSIEKTKRSISILIMSSDRIYDLDEKITLKLIDNNKYDQEINQIMAYKTGFFNLSEKDRLKSDSLIRCKIRNIDLYKSDSISFDSYLLSTISTNNGLRSIMKKSIDTSLNKNYDLMEKSLEKYQQSYRQYMITSSFVLLIFIVLMVLLVRDFKNLLSKNYGFKLTINYLINYIKSKK